jgi:hypothetical protein
VHKAFEAISWVLKPSISRVLIRIRCAASSCGAMIVAGTKTPSLVGMEEDEEGRMGRGSKALLDEAGRQQWVK